MSPFFIFSIGVATVSHSESMAFMHNVFAFFAALAIGVFFGWRIGAAAHTGNSQRGLLIAIAGVGAGFWVALTLGFHLHQQSAPMAMDDGLLPAAVLLAFAVTIGARSAWRSLGSRSSTLPAARLARGRSNAMAERKAWLAAMATDPVRSRYAAMIESGDVFWTPLRIEYDLDLYATTCCQHLKPIESGMRAAGVIVRLDSINSVRADCLIDHDALKQRFALPDCVSYKELQAYDRSLEDPPHAVVECSTCGSRMWVQHADNAAPETPVFPGATS